MIDPYKILNVSPDATDEEIKKSYRELARKYHPDNYHDSPLENMASEKMKEINEAYDTITKMRKGGDNASYTGYGGGYNQRGYAGYGSYAGGDPVYQQIRSAINRNDISTAEQMLNRITNHDAQWHFLMGAVYYRKGWLDEAKQYYETASRMEPNNAEYQHACDFMDGGGQAYRPQGFGSGGINNCDPCLAMICLNVACGSCCGGRFCIC